MNKQEMDAYNLAIEDCTKLFRLMIVGEKDDLLPEKLRDNVLFKKGKYHPASIAGLIPIILRSISIKNTPRQTVNSINSWKLKMFNGLRSLERKSEDHNITLIRFNGFEKRPYYNEDDSYSNIGEDTEWGQLDFNNGNLQGGFFDK